MQELQSTMPASKLNAQPPILSEDLPEVDPGDASAAAESAPGNLLADGLEQGKAMLNEHKGKLAIGVAATLGLMVFYKWREKKLAEEDPEEYARLQRIKAVVREQDADGASERDADD